MNTSQLKAYAPQARKDFIQAVTARANLFGLSDKKIEPAEIKGDVVIIAGRPFPKQFEDLRQRIVERINREGFDQVMESVAYTWFNRFIAIRYMELHDYLDHGYRVLSNRSDSDVPEILEQAANIDLPDLDKEEVIKLRLAGNKDDELYRLLIVAQCNALYQGMPFLFEQIGEATELLLPDNLLHSNSPIRKLVNEIDEEAWNDVEVIGWIYQFYISEKKDQVIGKVVKSEDIPAATQLFTPNWIVKYMVQNSLGAQWLATYPQSPLKEQMEYYIEPTEQEPEVQKQLDANTPNELNPEELTFLDPACGSGHILVEAYDVFKEIYLERGYRSKDIPKLILEKNLYGIDIDDRAAQLSCFALLMKARQDDRQILKGDDLELNVISMQSTKHLDAKRFAETLVSEKITRIIETNELFPELNNQPVLSKKYTLDITQDDISLLLKLFQDSKTYGSLITIPDSFKDKLIQLQVVIDERINKGNPLEKETAKTLVPIIKEAVFLSKQYDCVVTNPPYMGGKGMNSNLKQFAGRFYPESKSDLFAMFVERNLAFSVGQGNVAMITMQSWMFLSSFEKLREKILNHHTIYSMMHLGARAFDSIGGEVVSTTAFVLENNCYPEYKGCYIRLVDGSSESEKQVALLEATRNIDCDLCFRASAEDIKKIPGTPLAYWVSKDEIALFKENGLLRDVCEPKKGLDTCNNALFLRFWYEVALPNFSEGGGARWFPYNKGGDYRRWYGNREYVVNWERDGEAIHQYSDVPMSYNGAPVRAKRFYFKEGYTWTTVSGGFSARFCPSGAIFDNGGCTLFCDSHIHSYGAFVNSVVASRYLEFISPTLNFQPGDIGRLPIITNFTSCATKMNTTELVHLSQFDWDAYERSWDFQSLPILKVSSDSIYTLESSYTAWIAQNRETIAEMKRLEEENNRFFIDAYGLKDDLTPDVPIEQITLTVNPAYRYGDNISEEEQWTRFRQDTMNELVSYAIGCMMGRYSLDEPGLIYAHSGNEKFEPDRYKTFSADDDGIIPIMDLDWFPDDAANRFKEFLKVAWSSETLDENMQFVAESLGQKTNETPFDTVRRYLNTGFYKDHLKTYKKRPIYWLFSSGKQKAFECLVYLHRYNESTLARMRSSYVVPLQGKFNARLDHLRSELDAAATASAQKKIQKQIDLLGKKQEELTRFAEELRHYADMKINLDLDDGVKVNYGKFGNLLAEKKAIAG